MRFISLFIFTTLTITVSGQKDITNKAPHKILVVSGGGARGAWGVGVVSTLNLNNGHYKAVYGTSTGSLMAPFILLQEYDSLKIYYSQVTQSSIFSVNPFNVDTSNGVVTTKLKGFKAFMRFLFGKKTFGETKNLKNLIKKDINYDMFCRLIDANTKNNLLLGIAVTNTKTGGFELKLDTGYLKNTNEWDRLCTWIWASANEPLLMSYTMVNGIGYVDGGVREVVPIQEAISYAVTDPNIDSIDVIVNNSLIPESQNWNIADGGILNGLQRLLGIYNLGTVVYNENYSQLLLDFYNYTSTIPPKPNPAFRFMDSALAKRNIHLRLLCMPDSVAQKYPNELGFDPTIMQDLIKKGEAFGLSPSSPIEGNVNVKTMVSLLPVFKQ